MTPTLRIILIASTAFFIEKRFLSPFIGSNFERSGMSGFVVKINPVWMTFAKIPAIATAKERGMTIKIISLKEIIDT